jgi:hypothetical protein
MSAMQALGAHVTHPIRLRPSMYALSPEPERSFELAASFDRNLISGSEVGAFLSPTCHFFQSCSALTAQRSSGVDACLQWLYILLSLVLYPHKGVPPFPHLPSRSAFALLRCAQSGGLPTLNALRCAQAWLGEEAAGKGVGREMR